MISLLAAGAEEWVAGAMATLRLKGRVAILQTGGFPLQSKLLGCVALLRCGAAFSGAPAE
jgi:hypothetical protein